MSEDDVRPEDELEPEGNGKDEDGDLDDGGDEDLDDFDDELVSAARSVGLNPDDYESEDALYQATDRRIRAMELKGDAKDKSDATKEDKIALAAIEVALKNKGDLDDGLVEALEKLAASTGENFSKLVQKIEAQIGGGRVMEKRIESLNRSISALQAQIVQRRMDDWITEHPEVQKRLGNLKTGELDPDSREARLRRSLFRRADNLAGRQRGHFTMEQMFSRAFKKMYPKASPSETSSKKGKSPSSSTRLARASGASTGHVSDENASQDQVRAEAAAVVRKFRRNSN